MTIWTAVTMIDIECAKENGGSIVCSGLNVTQTIANGTETHIISTGDTGRMLGAGWLFYLCSLILNYIFYKMHPSSPEMWTWGAEKELKEWTPPEETQTQEEWGEFGF